MRSSKDRILTTHAGSLSRPANLIAMSRASAVDKNEDKAAYADRVADAVADNSSSALTSPTTASLGSQLLAHTTTAPGGITPSLACRFANRRDWQKFSEFYLDPESSGSLMGSAARRPVGRPACTGPIKYTGHAALRADIANLKKAMSAAGVEEAFMCSIGPGSFARGVDLYYKTEEEFLFASADAMHEEYKAIVDAGIVLQIDDPSLPDNWDMINPEPPLNEFKKFEQVRMEALNHALRGLSADRIRFHICWGSWHGPHTTDIPLKDIVDLVLSVNAGAYSVEAGNVRHEHEWRVWKDTKLPDGKLLIPGVVSHATNIVEHPQVVADRIARYAQVVGRENVIAGTDCGLGGRVHSQIAWAKLEALAKGAELASKELWR